ncbi:MAG: hypothetical protein ACRDRS_06785 [Pseudonocardiaceae bacterium]
MTDFHLALSDSTLAPGTYTFVAVNGEPHGDTAAWQLRHVLPGRRPPGDGNGDTFHSRRGSRSRWLLMKLLAMGRHQWSLRSALMMAGRLLGAGLTAAMGLIHLRLWVDGYREVPVLGTLFLVNASFALALAVVLLAVPARLRGAVAAITALFTAATLTGLIVSLTVGLLGVHESLRTPLVPTTLVIESTGVLVLIGLLGISSEPWVRGWWGR